MRDKGYENMACKVWPIKSIRPGVANAIKSSMAEHTLPPVYCLR